MFFANLSLFEFLSLVSVASAATVALYLLSRSRSRMTVATLRFWQNATQAAQQRRRRRVDQPWSLILQLLTILCLLLAIAQPRWGTRILGGRDHVLLLDTSAWMGAPVRNGDLSTEARRSALRWLRTLPSQDRVMVIRAGAEALPATRFESDRGAVEAAIRGSLPGMGALDLEQSLSLARQSQTLEARDAGEIVYIGAARLGSDPAALQIPPNFRYVPVSAPPANAGFTGASLQRVPGEATHWQATFAVRNYSAQPRVVQVAVGYGGAQAGARRVTLAPLAATSLTFDIRATAAGWIEARLTPPDAMPADDSVTLEVPSPEPLRIAVYSDSPELLRPVFSSDPRLAPQYLPASAYRRDPDAGLIVIDGFAPAQPPTRPSLWIAPPASASPIPARQVSGELVLSHWHNETPLGAGLRSNDLKLKGALVFDLPAGATAIASTPQGPVAALLQRGELPPLAVLGFHPMRTALRSEVAAPLLFANLLEALAPEALVERGTLAAAPGVVQMELPSGVDLALLKVTDEGARPVPYTLDGRTLRLFTARTGTVRVRSGAYEQNYSLVLPGYGAFPWDAPAGVAHGLPRTILPEALPRELWKWLAGLGLILILLEWWLFGRGRSWFTRSALPSLVFKGIAIVACLAAFLEPRLPVSETKQAVGLLIDTSQSVPDSSLARANEFANSARQAAGRNDLRELPFARTVRSSDNAERASGRFHLTQSEAGRATGIEAAIRQAAASLPSGRVPRLVLMSDGVETEGSAARAAQLAASLSIPVDTVLLPGRPEPRFRIDSAGFPAAAFTGERFPIDLTVTAPEPSPAMLDLTADGRPIGSNLVKLDAGENHIRAFASLNEPGSFELTGALRAGALGEARFAQAISFRAPRLLFLSQDPPGMEEHLLATLRAAHFDVDARTPLASATLDDYQIVVFNNWDLESLSEGRKKDLEKFVQRGGGLLVIGGEKNSYVEKKNPQLDALDRTLPATVAPPRSPEGAVVILIIDKSSSMEGRKIELARMAAIGVVENLRPIDQVGVLIFDNSHQWAVPLRKAEDRTLIKRLIAGIVPDGGTQIAPALAEAYRRIQSAQGAYKHIVLLTDGISEEGDSMSLSKDAQQKRVTISTVGLGQDVNRAYLEKIAQIAGGKSYFLTEPAGLEQILVKDVKEHTGSTTVEKPIYPRVVRQVETLEGLGLEHAPALKGYVRFQAKRAADMILEVEDKDPLYVRWQYGLGRSAVFTSDAKSRWAEAWVAWKGFDRFWENVLRDLLPHAQQGESGLTWDPAASRLIVDYRLADPSQAPAQPPHLFALGPGGFQTVLQVEKVAEGHYRAAFPIGVRRGMFRVRPVEDSRLFPETGLYLPEPELTATGNNEKLLRDISAWTGGVFNPSPAQIFRAPARALASWLTLWPGLLAVTLLFNLIEVFWRRFRRPGSSFSLPFRFSKAA
ncbi:MAG: VWA domain-containing protein [Bryobacteraceae bacterium]|nr:VWA domain-containing protein [Bryobacteraceae bacterium]